MNPKENHIALRRHVLKVMTVLIAFTARPSEARANGAQSDMNTQGFVDIEWTIAPALLSDVKANLRFTGDTHSVSDGKGIPLVAVIAGVVLLPYLADALLKLRSKLTKPGIVIDARERQLKIRTDPTIPKGMMLIVDKNGSKLYDGTEIKEPNDLAKLLGSITAK